MIEKAPPRIPKSMRSHSQNNIHTRVDEIMSCLEKAPFYNNLGVTDKAMGIDGVEWEGTDKPSIRKRIISHLGSNKFKVGKFTHRPGGQARNYVVIFKVHSGLTITNIFIPKSVSFKMEFSTDQ